jgi:hypothetical protein
MSSDHRLARGERPPESTGRNTASACSANAASGDLAAPIATSRAPRRIASVATASVSSVRPLHDNATTTSIGPIHDGSR